MPLHVQIDTYDDPRDPGCPVYHRAYAQIKVFCDLGAERKARNEVHRANKRKMNNAGAFHVHLFSISLLTQENYILSASE